MCIRDRVHEAAYRGGDAAWQYLEPEAARHGRAFLLRAEFGRTMLALLRCLAGLSAHTAASSGALAAKYLSDVRAVSRALHRAKTPTARLNVRLIDAQLAVIDGQPERALEQFRAASSEYQRLGWDSLEAPLTYVVGLLEGGDGGRQKREDALALAASQGWQNPRRYIAARCPVIDYLETNSR